MTVLLFLTRVRGFSRKASMVHRRSSISHPSSGQIADWPGLTAVNLSIYELHVGTITPEGSFLSLIDELPAIADLGVKAIEIMPVADFPGRWNWGYDGVAMFAPSRAYGRPEELQQLVDAAHRMGLGVLLDVVYNHLGPDGNYLGAYSPFYFTDRHTTPWGDAINYDGDGSRFVRDFVIDNAIQWIRDYHFDGLRLDASDTIVDDSPVHILAELQDRVRASTDREIVIIAEEARNDGPHDQDGFRRRDMVSMPSGRTISITKCGSCCRTRGRTTTSITPVRWTRWRPRSTRVFSTRDSIRNSGRRRTERE